LSGTGSLPRISSNDFDVLAPGPWVGSLKAPGAGILAPVSRRLYISVVIGMLLPADGRPGESMLPPNAAAGKVKAHRNIQRIVLFFIESLSSLSDQDAVN
jgi:hypothetical protein